MYSSCRNFIEILIRGIFAWKLLEDGLAALHYLVRHVGLIVLLDGCVFVEPTPIFVHCVRI